MNPTGDGVKTRNLIASIEKVCEAHGRTRINGAVASERTFRLQMDVMKQFARTLHEAGFMLEDCANLGVKHIDAVFDKWVRKRKLGAKTLQNQKSRVKQFCLWLGKKELAVHSAEIEGRYTDVFPRGFRVKTVADSSKSERGAGVDLQDLYRKAMAVDSRYAAMLMMQRVFGLRKKEVLLIKLWKADKGNKLELVSAITKNGRPREVPFLKGAYGESQRRILDYAKSMIRRWESMAWPDVTLRQAEQRYYALNRQIGLTKKDMGLTGHGLRTGHAEDVMLIAGVLPATLGGTKGMAPELARKAVTYDVSRTLGHNREVIAGAYVGAAKNKPSQSASLGYRFGDPITGHGIVGQVLLWVTEKPEPLDGASGRFHLPGEKRELAYVTAQFTEDGHEVDRLNVRQLVRKHRGVFADVEDRMDLIGLTLLVGE